MSSKKSKCIDYACVKRQLNGGDDIGDFYYCTEVGTEVGRGQDECLLDKFVREIRNGD